MSFKNLINYDMIRKHISQSGSWCSEIFLSLSLLCGFWGASSKVNKTHMKSYHSSFAGIYFWTSHWMESWNTFLFNDLKATGHRYTLNTTGFTRFPFARRMFPVVQHSLATTVSNISEWGKCYIRMYSQ